ncbi:MAG: hypothetical protein BGP06_04615 [Rhizobiales bacterium 65-9]|nr:hypothetical protein [Hyphomicrobiales bacterium]OJY39428.1 MAG: hypothetical protein BGP06_04615 [Rhizobiales bacterium 65-9]
MPRKARNIGLATLAILAALAAAPVVSVIAAGTIANVLDCRLDEGSAHPCLFKGADIGQPLYAMSVLGWLMLVAGPVLLVLLFVWIVIALNALRRRT